VLSLAATMAAVLTALHLCGRALLRTANRLEEEARSRLNQALATRHALIFGLAKLADFRDTDTGSHLDRICTFSAMLAEELRRGRPELDDDFIECLRLAASLHDIGKVGIPDAVLLKPGKLTPEERRVIEQHTLMGADTLRAIRERLGDDRLLTMGERIALEHHEKWDGTGYPNGLAGEGISLEARIVALADVYDALTSKRSYKDAMPHAEARRIILAERGRHFDPAIVDAFDRIHERFEILARALHARDGTGMSYRSAA